MPNWLQNDGTYFQKTTAGNYYPDKVQDWVWNGINFFVSKEVLSRKAIASLAEMFPSKYHFVVTHKETGYCIPYVNSSTITDAKICAKISLDKFGYKSFLEMIKSLNTTTKR